MLPPTEARPVEAQPPSTDPAESELIPERTESAPAVDRIETGGAPEDPAEPVPQAEIHTRVHPAVTEALPATTEVSTTAETDAEHLDDPTALATDPSPETGPAPSESITVEEGIILLESPTLDQARAPFLEATSAGHRGLWLTREPPDRIRLHLHRRDVDVAWISSLSRPGAIRPSDLAGISQRILLALREGRATTVMFEGIEYLVSLHSAERALPALREIDSEARGRHARVWVALNPDLIPGPELQALRSGTDSRTIAAEPSAPTS